MGYECFVCYGHSVFAGAAGFVTNNKTVFANQRAGCKADILYDNLLSHLVRFQSSLTAWTKAGRAETLGSSFLMLEAHYVFRLQALGAFADLKLYSLALVQAAVTFRLNGRVMHENILTGLPLNEAKTLASVEPLYGSLFFHEIPLLV
jgi:hypothetical protein